jgi:hypothetical protein
VINTFDKINQGDDPNLETFCILSVGDKVLKVTEVMSSNSPSWCDEPVEIVVCLQSPLESHVTIEVKYSLLPYFH